MSRDLEAFAARVAVRAGELIKNMRTNAAVTTTTKTSAVDMVTEADKRAEQLISKLISSEFPHDAILGEEGGLSTTGHSGITWVIDPIDGTTNYVYGHTASCVSIAATVSAEAHTGEHNLHSSPVWVGEPSEIPRRTIAAVVYNPFTDELFSAAEGAGARLNNQPIQTNAHAELATALVATGFGYTEERRREQAQALANLLPQIRDIRRIGSAAYDLCLLACGRLDAYYERGIQEWDFAAGALIASEAGATLIGASAEARPGSALLIAAHPELAKALQPLVSPRV